MKQMLLSLSLFVLIFTAGCTGIPPTPLPPLPSTSTPGPISTVVWPTLTELQPAQAIPGQQIRVIGSGGYLTDSQGGYDESYRTFALYFDGQEVSSIGCYVNRCEGEFMVPTQAVSGTHQVSTEGGSGLALQVSPASEPVAITPSPTETGPTLLYLQNGTLLSFDLHTLSVHPIPLPVQGELHGAVLSYDGRYLAYADKAGLSWLDTESEETFLWLAKPAPSDPNFPDWPRLLPLAWGAQGYLLVGRLEAMDEGGPSGLGWITLAEQVWHDVPLPIGIDNYGCYTGVDWAPGAAQLAISGLGYGHPCNLHPGLTVVNIKDGIARHVVERTIVSGLEGGQPLIAGAHTPAWSPDGAWIAFGLDEDAIGPLEFPTRLYLVRPDGSDLTPLTSNAQGRAADPVWAADGALYYALSGHSPEADGIYRYDPADQAQAVLVSGTNLCPLSFSPDNAFLLYREGCNWYGGFKGLKAWSLVDQQIVAIVTGQDGEVVPFAGWLGAH